jgi:hypothetical protein
MESEDGTALYYRSANWIVKAGVEGSGETRIVDVVDPDATFFAARDGIYYTTFHRDFGLHFISFKRGSSSQLLKSDKQPWWSWIGVSPDSRWVLYAQLDGQPGSDLMMVENFR